MTNQDILTKAVLKSIARGWDEYGKLAGVFQPLEALDDTFMVEMGNKKYGRRFNHQAIIFNKGFAKALWGDEPKRYYFEQDVNAFPPISKVDSEDKGLYFPNYAYHLALMVIADDPIKYLGDNI